MGRKRFCTILIILVAVTMTGSASADIYRHLDEDGTAWFTDTPQDGRFVQILRERKTSRRPLASSTTLPHKPPTATRSSEVSNVNSSRPGDQFELPIQGRITSPSGMRSDPIDGKLRHHNGIDIAAPTGTPVKPVAHGQVVYSGNRSGYGNMMIVDHLNGTLTIYAHHSANLAAVGDYVDKGSVIALTGSTGRSTGPHLHFEAWRYGENITGNFLPDSYSPTVNSPVTAHNREAPIKRVLQNDGTILFTNLR